EPYSWRSPLTNVPSSDWASQPYSLCISKIKFDATPDLIVPHSSRRVRKLLPVPLLPKMPFDRSTSRSKSIQTGTSISSGRPTSKWVASSLPKTRWKSLSSASCTGAKWCGIVFTGSKPSSRSRGSISIGLSMIEPYVDVPASTSWINWSPLGGSTSTFWLVASSTTSVIIEKNSCRSPLITTNFPTPISSTLSRPSRRALSSSTSEALVMTPSRLREIGGIGSSILCVEQIYH